MAKSYGSSRKKVQILFLVITTYLHVFIRAHVNLLYVKCLRAQFYSSTLLQKEGDTDTWLSKSLSYITRHGAEKEGLKVEKGAPVHPLYQFPIAYI